MPTETVMRVQADQLQAFCRRVFHKLGVRDGDAQVIAEVLLAAELRGVESHGVARMRFYLDFLKQGWIVPRPDQRLIAETPATALIDAGAGFGPPPARRAMQLAICKALDVGAGFVSVRNSSHYGIAGYYAMLALEHDCIGISTCNSSPLVTPTFGRVPMLGSNPIALAAPAGDEWPFVLDMATCTVPLGKLELYERLGKPLPSGWAADETGRPTNDAKRALDARRNRLGGGLLPLGGAGEELGGHKGYGLALAVDILSAVLSGASFANLTYSTTPDGKPTRPGIGQFFGAWRVDAFRPVPEFKAAMDDLQRRLKASPKAEGQRRIYIHGEKEHEIAAARRREGLPLTAGVLADLRSVAQEVGVDFDIEPAETR